MRILFLVFIMMLSAPVFAQTQQPPQSLYSRAELEARKRLLQDSIKMTESELDAVKNDKHANLTQLKILQNKLAERQHLIGNINDEIGDIDNNIRSSAKEVDELKGKLGQLKVQYAQSIRYDYETRSAFGVMAYLFSSSDFNDAMRRMKYLKKFRDFRVLQTELIYNTQTQIQHKIGVLNNQKKEKDQLLTEQEQQKQQLSQETSKTNQVLQELKGRENELLKQIEKNKKTAARIDKAVDEIIKREIAKSQEKARVEAAEKAKREKEHPQPAKTNPVATNNPPSKTAPKTPETSNVSKSAPKTENEPPLLLTPTDIELASNFEGNRGKLYWPVEKGFITDHFGTHPSPLAKGVDISNSGIDIRTSQNALVRAVFDGDVCSIFNVDGREVVLIQHGSFFTLYNGLATVSVSKGQHIKTLQKIGTVGDDDDGVPTLKFQIWKSAGKKGSVKLNPEQWIGKVR